ncbi:hypothetical protein UlMin_017518 [Ulmus minor]
MDVYAGDRKITNPNDLPQHIVPFPEPTDLVNTHPTEMIPGEIISNCPIFPPQKLRPIRCSGKSPVNDFPDDSGTVGVQGFPSKQAVKVEPGDAQVNGDFGQASGVAEDRRQVGSGWEIVRRGRVHESSSSSSSSDDFGYSAAISLGPMKRKRKRRRKSKSKVEHFLENLVMKVIEKQEQMHKQLMDTLEKKEKERIAREEAWKQQEMERVKREKEMRTQETSRSLALISFIESYLGHQVQTPPPVAQQTTEENEVQADSQTDTKYEKRWPETEVRTLITLRATLDHKFRVAGSKESVWEEISARMCNMGYNRAAKKCKEKWENINKYFKNSKRSGNGKTCPYFHELDLLYKKGIVNSGKGICITEQPRV